MIDDELPDNAEEFAPVQGPRRSTFTPPPARVNDEPARVTNAGATDDDALAAALAQQFARPEPASSIPPPPQRQSLSDDELLAAADLDAPDHDTSSLLDLVERELQLRQQEAAQLAEWEERVRQTAGPDAEQLVTEVRSQFTGVIPIIPPPAPEPPLGVLPSVPPVESVPLVESEPEPPRDVPPPVEPSPVADAAPAAIVAPTGPELDLALADAPPPLGAAVTAVPPPPGSVPAPPELVEPSPLPVAERVVSAPTAFEAMLAAADAATGETTAAHAAVDSETDVPWRMEEQPELGHAEPETPPSDDESPDASVSATSVVAGSVLAAPALADPALAEPVLAAQARPPRVERIGLEPTPAEYRTGRSIRLFWLWFAVNSSVVSVALGAVLLGLGMSLRQSILAALIGVAVSFLPLGLGTLASKWSGQPTMVVSRATFGTAGNVIPALLAVVTRVVWAAALLWMLGTGVAEVLVGGAVVEGVSRLDLSLAVTAAALVIAAVIAGLGYRAIAVLGAVVTVLGLILVAGLIALTVPYVDLNAALSVPDGPWLLMATGAVLVFSVVGLAWANSSGDLARYQAKGTAGSAAVLFTAFGATIPAFALISWGALLAASNPFIAEGLVDNPVDIVSRMLPLWYPVPLVLAVALGLLAAATLALYSGGFALLAVGIRTSRTVAVVIAVVIAAGAAAALALVVPDVTALFRDVVTTLAVPVAAWAGIFGAETMIRTRRVHSPSLLAGGGVYPRVRWVNTVMLLVVTGIGWGLTTATLTGLQWQGYLWTLLGVPLDDALAAADLGVAIALMLGLLTPIIAGIPALRALQSAERQAALSEGSETATSSIAVDATRSEPMPPSPISAAGATPPDVPLPAMAATASPTAWSPPHTLSPTDAVSPPDEPTAPPAQQ